jgi:hypothetical protein
MLRKSACSALLIAGALAVSMAACTGYVKRGASLYGDGRYIEAAEVFERTEDRLRNASSRERAEYGLYRGLTLLVLGDLRTSERWMTYAYRVEQRRPGSLRADRKALLDRGWYQLGQRLANRPAPAVTVANGSELATRQAPTFKPTPTLAAPSPRPASDASTTPASQRASVRQ